MKIRPGDVKFALISKKGVTIMVCDTRRQAENAAHDLDTPCGVQGYVSKARRDPNKFAKRVQPLPSVKDAA